MEIADGNSLSLQATGSLSFSQSGTNTLELAVTQTDTTQIIDANGDTQIQVEEGSNDDTIRFDTAGQERLTIAATGEVVWPTLVILLFQGSPTRPCWAWPVPRAPTTGACALLPAATKPLATSKASIDLHGNDATANTGVLDLVAGKPLGHQRRHCLDQRQGFGGPKVPSLPEKERWASAQRHQQKNWMSTEVDCSETENDFDITGNEQLLFSYNQSSSLRHAIRTRHRNTSTSDGNAIDFYTWDMSLANTDLPTRLGMTVNNGRVGIGDGMLNPTETLTVSGTAQITGALKDSSGDAGTAGQILSSTGNGTNWIAPSGGGSNTDSQTLAFGSSATTTETTLEIADGNVLTLQATGSLTFNQTGTNTLQVSAPVVDTTQTIDTDGDTKIQMEENGVDDDTVRFDANGREALSIKEDRLTLSMKPLFTGGVDNSSVSFTPGYNGADNVQMVFIETSGIGDPNEIGLRFSVGNTMPTIDAVIGDANARRHFNFGGEKNVGIGYPVNEPQATLDNFKLNVLGNFMTTENAQIGSPGEELVLGQMGTIANFAGLAHKYHATNTGYALLQQSSGQTLLNAPTGQGISFRINSTEHMRLHSNGHLGIKTGDPLQPLDVNGTALFRNGGNSTVITGNEQILFGWNGTNQYQQAIRTRHNGGSPNNAIDFYTWDSSLAANTDLPTRLGMTVNNGKVGIGDGMLHPTETLTVSGTALVTGNFETGGSISQTGTGVLHPDYVFEQYFEGASEVNPAYAMPSLESVEAL